MCGFFGHGFYWEGKKQELEVVFDFEVNSHSRIKEYQKIPDSAKRCGFKPENGEPVSNEDKPLPKKVGEKINLMFQMYFPNREAVADWIRKNYAKNADKDEWDLKLPSMLADRGEGLFSEKYYQRAIEYYQRQIKDYQREIEDYQREIEYYQGWIEYYCRRIEYCQRGIEDYQRQILAAQGITFQGSASQQAFAEMASIITGDIEQFIEQRRNQVVQDQLTGEVTSKESERIRSALPGLGTLTTSALAAIGDPTSPPWQYCECDFAGTYQTSGTNQYVKFSNDLTAADYIIVVTYV